jgi:hypothetical protein
MSVFFIRVRTAWDDNFSGSSPSQTFATTKYTTVQPTPSTNVFFSNCLFIRCTSTSNVVAIYFSNTNTGESVLHKVCGNDCSYGQFTCVNVPYTVSNRNHVNYSSISRCVNEYTLFHYNGKFCFYSGIYCTSYVDSSAATCLLLYTSFADNFASGFFCICQIRTATKAEMKYCNIYMNSQGSLNLGGTICFDGDSIVKASLFRSNILYIFDLSLNIFPVEA